MKQKKFPWIFISVVFVLSVATVWIRLQMIQVTYRINKVTQMTKKEQERLDLLRLKVAKLRSPKRLERLAKKSFHLTPPQVGQTIYVRDKKIR